LFGDIKGASSPFRPQRMAVGGFPHFHQRHLGGSANAQGG
jgi:hypothetical protein